MSAKRPSRSFTAAGHGGHGKHKPPGGSEETIPASAQGVARGRLLFVLIPAVLAIAAAVQWPVLSVRTICFDDREYIFDNAVVQSPSWESAGRFLGEVRRPSTVRGYYQPLNMISLMLDWAMGGRPENHLPFHRTSLLIHLVNTALVITLLRQLLGRPVIAAGIGLLFGIHPMTIEVIAWLGERKTLLAACFSLTSLVLYVRHARRPSIPAYTGCLVAYLLALLSKPTSTPLPLVMLLLDAWPLHRLGRRAILEKLPHFVLAGVFSIITYVSQAETAGAYLPGETGGITRVVLTLCHNIIFYPAKIIAPVRLSSHYPFPRPFELSNAVLFFSVLGTALLIGVLVWSLRKTRAAVIGFLIFFFTIFPTMQVIGFSNVIAADKFAYLPSIGFMLVLAWGVGQAFSRPSASPKGGRRSAAAAVLIFTALVAMETRATRRQLDRWQESERYYRHMLSLAPKAAEVNFIYGIHLAQEQRTDEAIERFGQAVESNPMLMEARTNLALLLAQAGRMEEAFAVYQSVPEPSEQHPDALNGMGFILAAHGRAKDAIPLFREAIRRRPDFAEAHFNLGCALAEQGEIQSALASLREALRLDPADMEAAARIAALEEVARKAPAGE